MKKFFSLLATLLVLALAIWIGRTLWVHYMETPWTRDGRVRADIINVAADVNGYVVNVPVKDNQLVKKGDVLLEIDPEHYEIAVKQAEALVASRKATWDMRKLNATRRAQMDNLVISRENRDDASNLASAAFADYQHALQQLEAAKLDLLDEARAGRFREDLAYRLTVAELRLAPLRERREDIALLYDAFSRHAAERLGRSLQVLSGPQLSRLLCHAWPGNVRELANVAERDVLGLGEPQLPDLHLFPTSSLSCLLSITSLPSSPSR